MRRGKGAAPEHREESLKILLINPFGIGDVLFSTPLIRILRERFPEATLHYICNKRTVDVLERCPGLTAVHVFEKGDYKRLWRESKTGFFKELFAFIKRIRKERFDIAIDMSMGHQYGFFLKAIGVPERVGFDYKGRGRFHTKRLPFEGFDDKPIGEYYKDLVKMIGADSRDDVETGIWWSAEEDGYIDGFLRSAGLPGEAALIGMAPGGGVSFGREKIAFKRWPARKFAGLADRLIKDAGAKVVLLWGPGGSVTIPGRCT
jgi:ADP-heptose:LPS heptosyltransferase